jgi:hypothetical protein
MCRSNFFPAGFVFFSFTKSHPFPYGHQVSGKPTVLQFNPHGAIAMRGRRPFYPSKPGRRRVQDSDVSAAERAGGVPDEPAVDARHVENVPASRQPPGRLAHPEILEAHRAAQRVAGRVHGGVLVDLDLRQLSERVGVQALGAARLEQVGGLGERRADGADLQLQADRACVTMLSCCLQTFFNKKV